MWKFLYEQLVCVYKRNPHQRNKELKSCQWTQHGLFYTVRPSRLYCISKIFIDLWYLLSCCLYVCLFSNCQYYHKVFYDNIVLVCGTLCYGPLSFSFRILNSFIHICMFFKVLNILDNCNFIFCVPTFWIVQIYRSFVLIKLFLSVCWVENVASWGKCCQTNL